MVFRFVTLVGLARGFETAFLPASLIKFVARFAEDEVDAAGCGTCLELRVLGLKNFKLSSGSCSDDDFLSFFAMGSLSSVLSMKLETMLSDGPLEILRIR